jgi:hypothetical protein
MKKLHLVLALIAATSVAFIAWMYRDEISKLLAPLSLAGSSIKPAESGGQELLPQEPNPDDGFQDPLQQQAPVNETPVSDLPLGDPPGRFRLLMSPINAGPLMRLHLLLDTATGEVWAGDVPTMSNETEQAGAPVRRWARMEVRPAPLSEQPDIGRYSIEASFAAVQDRFLLDSATGRVWSIAAQGGTIMFQELVVEKPPAPQEAKP